MTNQHYEPATMRSVLEEQFREICTDQCQFELALMADYYAAQMVAAITEQVDFGLQLKDPFVGNPPNPLEQVILDALRVAAGWQYADEHPEDGTAGWSSEMHEDELVDSCKALLEARGMWVIKPHETEPISEELASALEEVEADDDREYGWALHLAEALRTFLTEQGYAGLPPVGPGVEREVTRSIRLADYLADRAAADRALGRIEASVDEIAEEQR